MEHLGDVVRYIDALTFAKNERGRSGWRWGRLPFVTISRQSGAGGHSLAETLLLELSRRRPDVCRGWLSFDDQLARLLGADPRYKANLRALLTEDYDSAIHDVVRRVFSGGAPQDVALERVFSAIRALAGVGKAVILGRGGVCLTQDLPGGIHVRLVAGRESRLRLLRRRLFIGAAEAPAKLDELEAARAGLIRDHFGQDVGNPLLYDAVWNTAQVSLEEIAAWIADRVEEKAERLSAQEASQRAASMA